MKYVLYVKTFDAEDGEHNLTPPANCNVLARYVGQHEGRVLVALLLVVFDRDAFDDDDDDDDDISERYIDYLIDVMERDDDEEV